MDPEIKEEDRVKDKVALHSEEGQRMLEETPIRQLLLFRLFKEQVNDTFCGLQSAAVVMSARYLGQKFPDPSSHLDCDISNVPYREENLFDFEETKRALDYDECDRVGMTMPQLHGLFPAHGLPIKSVHADTSSVEEFRAAASEALGNVDSKKGVIVNFDTYFLGQHDVIRGHFGVLAAYHSPTDRFLLLDTTPDSVDCWVKAGDLFKCMNTFDKDADMYRGYMVMG